MEGEIKLFCTKNYKNETKEILMTGKNSKQMRKPIKLLMRQDFHIFLREEEQDVEKNRFLFCFECCYHLPD